jgi:hypothetical protein
LWGNNHNFATVGIESPDHRDGLECTFAGMRPAAVAALGPNRAIRFTTNPPDTFTPVVERWPDRRAVKGFEVRPSLTRGPVTCLLPADAGAVNVDITDVLGRVVRVAAAAGPDWQWDLADNAGRRVPAGVYRITLTGSAGGHRLSSTRIAVLD